METEVSRGLGIFPDRTFGKKDFLDQRLQTEGNIFRRQTMTLLNSGDPAPAFSATDQTGNTVSLSDFKNRKCFIFFYPKANTSG